jgi:hypothetical protein
VATVPKSLRDGRAGGPARIATGFVATGEGRVQVGLAREEAADAKAAAEMKACRRDRLAVPKTLLEH